MIFQIFSNNVIIDNTIAITIQIMHCNLCNKHNCLIGDTAICINFECTIQNGCISSKILLPDINTPVISGSNVHDHGTDFWNYRIGNTDTLINTIMGTSLSIFAACFAPWFVTIKLRWSSAINTIGLHFSWSNSPTVELWIDCHINRISC